MGPLDNTDKANPNYQWGIEKKREGERNGLENERKGEGRLGGGGVESMGGRDGEGVRRRRKRCCFELANYGPLDITMYKVTLGGKE